jgi:hypothetical protein
VFFLMQIFCVWTWGCGAGNTLFTLKTGVLLAFQTTKDWTKWNIEFTGVCIWLWDIVNDFEEQIHTVCDFWRPNMQENVNVGGIK